MLCSDNSSLCNALLEYKVDLECDAGRLNGGVVGGRCGSVFGRSEVWCLLSRAPTTQCTGWFGHALFTRSTCITNPPAVLLPLCSIGALEADR